MDYRPTPQDEQFRKELKAWIARTFPSDQPPPKMETREDRINAYRDYQRKVFEGGYAGIRYPKEYSGQGGTLMQEIITSEELGPIGRTHAASVNVIGFGMGIPTVFTVGTPEQKEKFLRKSLDGTCIWCQAFSEPNAGSDVASISTRAERMGDHYVVNGQKVWITNAQYADWCMLLVRTNPNVAKHKGLSYLLMDMKAPGVEVRPIQQLTGEAEFNEIFIDNVQVPVENLVGEENGGWSIALTTLMFERVMGDLSTANQFLWVFEQLWQMVKGVKRRGRPILEDPGFRQKLAQMYIEILVLKYNGYRSLDRVLKGGIPGAEGSVGKIIWSELNPRMTELALEIEGPYSQLIERSAGAIEDGRWQYMFLRAKGNTVEAGSAEIQRNIIGERVLGLPKDLARMAPAASVKK